MNEERSGVEPRELRSARLQISEYDLQLPPEDLLGGSIECNVVDRHPQLTLVGMLGNRLQRDSDRKFVSEVKWHCTRR